MQLGGDLGEKRKHDTSAETELHWNRRKFTLATEVASKSATKIVSKNHMCKWAFKVMLQGQCPCKWKGSEQVLTQVGSTDSTEKTDHLRASLPRTGI